MKLHDKRALMFDKPTSVIAAAGNGHIAFNGARNAPLKSTVFYGACEQKTLAGRNLFDTSLVPMDGKYVASKSGDLVVNSAWQHSGYIPVTAGIRYRFVASHSSTSNAGMAWYNSAKTYISGVSAGTMRSSSIITAPANAAYARISWNISVNPEWESTVWFYDYGKWGADAVWEEYCGGIHSPNPDYPQPVKSNNSKWTLNDSSADLSAISLNGIGNAKDTYDSQTGLLTRRIGVVDLGGLNWLYNTSLYSFPIFYAEKPNTKINSVNMLCSIYENVIGPQSSLEENQMMGKGGIGKSVWVRDSRFNNAADFKYAMSGVFLYYELATPTTEYISPQSITQIKGENILRQVSGEISDTAAQIEYYGRV